MLNQQEETQTKPIIEKPNRGERIKKSVAARLRRKEVKEVKNIHSYKEEKDAKERLKAKRTLEKQKKNARQN